MKIALGLAPVFRPALCVFTLACACASHSAFAYTMKTYHGEGASRIEACSLARNDALSPTAGEAHGHLLKLGKCDCGKSGASGKASAWQCTVQVTHER
ncbi:hypothetical protein QCE63_24515 [Caballeronia sp. LZ065]|uniref:hypothetical protein n=1 Tax=Caballeronia sp. LZ065 TaxID=3038571 RepID=UPI002862EB1D|nr:hypothetical protein [Caballeronia sp. LZ065]MDR5782572.1 hypothetical protein [Caballeronia sp. LZ065]